MKKNIKLNHNLVKLVALLNDGRYHDGSSLGKALKLSRNAIWKFIHKLKTFGVMIDSVKSKGYALLEPLVLLDADSIKKNLQNKRIVEVFESIDSTSAYLKNKINLFQKSLLRNNAQHLICLAELQTEGKGRFQREWFSPFGKNIYLSCLYSFPMDVSQLTGLSLVVSLAVLDTIKSYNILKPIKVKWPNDIMYDEKKLAGVLVEVQAETNGLCHAIIGIGLNTNMMKNDLTKITQDWVSLREICGEYIQRNELATRLINTLDTYLMNFIKEGFSFFLDDWRSADYLLGKDISLKSGNNRMTGNVKGIDVKGQILLKTEEGNILAFSSGEASIQKPT